MGEKRSIKKLARFDQRVIRFMSQEDNNKQENNMESYINADLSHPFARVSIEEAYSEDDYPTPEMRAAELESMGYDFDTADTGSGEVVIPAHAFYYPQ